MEPLIDVVPRGKVKRNERWDRVRRAELLEAYHVLQAQGFSQRQAATELQKPRSIIQAWVVWQDSLDAYPRVVEFFQSVPGLAFLHRLVLALHVVFVEIGACGIRCICLFLEMTGLNRFVGASYGTQQQINRNVEEAMVAYTCEDRIMSVILLTGASGFVGSCIKKLLIGYGCRLRVLSRKLGADASPIEWFTGDLTDAETCRRAVAGVEIVIHAAGEKRNSTRFWSVNVLGTENLLAAAIKERVERFLYLSSVGVMGADPLQSKVFDEGALCMPQTDYERSKWEAEKRVCRAGLQGLPVAILRPTNVFGDQDPLHNLLTIARTVRDGKFFYLGGRNAVLNLVFVEDVANACLILVEHPDAVGHMYHLSDACTIGEFVDALADELNVKRPSLELPDSVARLVRMALRGVRQVPWLSNSSTIARMVSLNNQASFATTRLSDELGFRCVVGWRVGLGRIVRWYRAQGEI